MLFPARYASRPPGYEVAERLLAGRDAPAGADASERALSRVLTAAAQPGTESELAGEASARAAFLLATCPATARRSRWRARPHHARPGQLPRRAPVLAGAFSVMALVSVYGTAAAGVLPPPMQRIAHTILPQVPAPSRIAIVPGTAHSHARSDVPSLTSSGSAPAGTPGSSSDPSQSAGAGNAQGSSGQGNSDRQGLGRGNGDSNSQGQGHGKGKGSSSNGQ